MARINENVQLVAAMYDSYVQMSRSERVKRLLWYSLAVIILAGISVIVYFGRKSWKQSRRADYMEELLR